MTQEETIKGNELIAGFMNIWVTRFLGKDKKAIGLVQCDDELGNFEWSDFGLDWYNPNSNWNQLMPVVEKMCHTKIDWLNATDTDTYYPRTFGMLQQDTGLPMVRINANQVFVGATLIEATFIAVVDFIEWYNLKNTQTPHP